MFKIYEFRYRDKKSGLGFVFYARDEAFADELANRITALGMHNLKRKRICFKKKGYTEYPPYELERNQIEYVENMENNYKVVNG